MALLRGVVFKEKSIGPRAEPHKSLLNLEGVEPILIHWRQSVRWDSNHLVRSQ